MYVNIYKQSLQLMKGSGGSEGEGLGGVSAERFIHRLLLNKLILDVQGSGLGVS